MDRLDNSIAQLEKEKEMMKEMMRRARGSERSVQKEVANTIDEKIYKAKEKLELCEQLEREIENE
jgi:hypothetical protein